MDTKNYLSWPEFINIAFPEPRTFRIKLLCLWSNFVDNCSLLKSDLRFFFRFIKLIPAFYRLYSHYGYEPEGIRFVFQQYQDVICELTGGRLSKLGYYARDIITAVYDYMNEEDDE